MTISDGIEAVTIARADRRGVACCGATVRRNGTILWTGERGCECPGMQVGRFNPSHFDQLATFIVRAGVFSWDSPAEPAPGTDDRLTIHTVDGDRTTSSSDSREPNDFWVIASLIDHLADQAEWTPAPVTK